MDANTLPPGTGVYQVDRGCFTEEGKQDPISFLVSKGTHGHGGKWWHFLDHMAPIYWAYKELRGEVGPFYAHPDLLPYAEARGLPIEPFTEKVLPGSGPVCVCNEANLRKVLKMHRPVIHIEHGCGLMYERFRLDRRGDKCNVIVAPGAAIAGRYALAYPQAVVLSVGSPKMDGWHRRHRDYQKPGVEDFTICFSTHFDRTRCPETRSTFPYYLPVLPELKAYFGDRIIGHSHPLYWPTAKARYEEVGIEPVEDFEEVLERADVYCTDASSTLYEFASLNRPVVALNAPWYRRDVDHGLRFWDYVPGIQCDSPEDLIECIMIAFADPPSLARNRREAVEYTYAFTDGKAACRAAKGILEWQKCLM